MRKKPYNATRVRAVHNRIIALVDAKGALRRLGGYDDLVAKFDAEHRELWQEMSDTEEPVNPVYDLP